MSAVASTLARALGLTPALRTEPTAVALARSRLRDAHAEARIADHAHQDATRQLAHARKLIVDAAAAGAALTLAEADATEVARCWAKSGAATHEPIGDARTFSRLATARITNLEAQTRAHGAANTLRTLERRQIDLADKMRCARTRIRTVASEMLTARCLPLFETLARAGREYFAALDQLEVVKLLLSGAAARTPTHPCYHLHDPGFFERYRAATEAIAASRQAAPGTPGASRLEREWLALIDALARDPEAQRDAGGL
jgi:hypothetical protein